MKIKFITTGMVTLLIAGFGIYKYFDAQEAQNEKYTFTKAQTKDITQTVSANGTLNPVIMVSVGTQVSGTVQKLYVDYNSYVKKGQILAELDPVIFKSQLAQSEADVANAKASLDLADANFKRSNELFEKGYISKQEFDQSMQALKSAKASLALTNARYAQSKSNLDFSVIRSPVSGVVVDRQIDAGQTVAASFQTPTLFKIAQDLRKMQIDSNFAEADIGQIKVGQKATFSVDAYPNKTFEGNVTQIRLSPIVSQNVVTYDVVINVENEDELLKPGMTAFVSICVNEAKNALALPNAALRFKPADFQRDIKQTKDKKFNGSIYTFKDGNLSQLKVQTGITDGKFTQIISNNITKGQEVIISENINSKAKSDIKPPPRMF